MFIGRTDAEAETPELWPPHVKSWLIGKDPDAGKDWGQEEKGLTEDEMAGWHHRLDGHGFDSTPGVGDGQGGLVCCDSWGHKESDTTERLNWTELMEVGRLEINIMIQSNWNMWLILINFFWLYLQHQNNLSIIKIFGLYANQNKQFDWFFFSIQDTVFLHSWKEKAILLNNLLLPRSKAQCVHVC